MARDTDETRESASTSRLARSNPLRAAGLLFRRFLAPANVLRNGQTAKDYGIEKKRVDGTHRVLRRPSQSGRTTRRTSRLPVTRRTPIGSSTQRRQTIEFMFSPKRERLPMCHLPFVSKALPDRAEVVPDVAWFGSGPLLMNWPISQGPSLLMSRDWKASTA